MVETIATCVPYFPHDDQVGRSLFLLLFAKPVTYLLFVLCFRYRVSTPRPLHPGRIAIIVLAATIVGCALVTGEAFFRWSFTSGQFPERNFVSWTILIALRVATWIFLGGFAAELRGRRLIGWIISAAGIDLTFDMAISAAFDGSWIESGYAGLGFLCFLAPLYMIGRRPSLKARFLSSNICRKCAHDLTGLMPDSACPECGTTAQQGGR